MTCGIERSQPRDDWNRIIQRISTNILGGAKVVPESNEWYLAANEMAAQQAFWSVADQMWKEQDPRTACCDNLVKMAADRGVYPYPAAFAAGYVQITGTAGAVIPSNLQFAINGGYYTVDPTSSIPSVMPSTGSLVVKVIADQPGDAGNSSGSAATGQTVATIDGIDQDVTVAGGNFCGGIEAEGCEEFRARYIDRKKYRPDFRAGTIEDDLRERPCVTRVCQRNCECCPDLGRLEYFVFFDGTFDHGVPPQNILDDMTAWYFGTPNGSGRGIADWGVRGEFYAAEPVVIDVRVSNIPCGNAGEVESLRERLSGVFDGLCPGQLLCSRVFDAVIVQALGTGCDYEVEMYLSGDPIALCGDYQPECNQLAVPGTISIDGDRSATS